MSDLKTYLGLRARKDEVSRRVFAHIQTQPPEKDEAIAQDRKELGDLHDRIKEMEAEAGFVEQYGRIRAITES